MNADKLAEAKHRIRNLFTMVAIDGSACGAAQHEVEEIFTALAEHDAQAAQARNSLLIGTTPDGRPYGLHGTKESVEAVSDLIEAQAVQPVGVPDGWVMVPRQDFETVFYAGFDRDTVTRAEEQTIDAARDRLEKALCAPHPPAQPSADAEDAARYRWLRDMRNRERASDMVTYKMNLDAAIDAARAAESGE